MRRKLVKTSILFLLLLTLLGITSLLSGTDEPGPIGTNIKVIYRM